jgi:glycosyltransferase involved in cell wall biosynthesis
MTLLGLIAEPPFDPLSWSGSSAHFFRALQRQGVISGACEVSLSRVRDALWKGRALSLPMRRWKERYHSSVPRFGALTKIAGEIVAKHRDISGVLQIGAWFSAAATTKIPCFSYHDGNAALLYRYYGRGLLSEGARLAHLRWERSVYKGLTGIFVMSEWLADSFIRDFDVPRSKVHVVGGGINFDKLPQVPERSWSTPRYLLVGKDFERKGGKYLLDAFKIVQKALPDAELILIGPSVAIEQPGVKCVGYLSKSNPADMARLSRFFCSATAMVLPSIYEPFGISLLEGMAYGLPCIAVDRCALPEIVRHGETGVIARAEDAASLADAMIKLGRNPRSAAAMGAAGRARVESHFTWTTVTANMKTILSDIYRV